MPAEAAGTAIRVLINEIIWPNDPFVGSMQRMREYLANRGFGDVAHWSDDAVRDEMPSLYEFRFLQRESRGGFWDGWETSFPSVDSAGSSPSLPTIITSTSLPTTPMTKPIR